MVHSKASGSIISILFLTNEDEVISHMETTNILTDLPIGTVLFLVNILLILGLVLSEKLKSKILSQVVTTFIAINGIILFFYSIWAIKTRSTLLLEADLKGIILFLCNNLKFVLSVFILSLVIVFMLRKIFSKLGSMQSYALESFIFRYETGAKILKKNLILHVLIVEKLEQLPNLVTLILLQVPFVFVVLAIITDFLFFHGLMVLSIPFLISFFLIHTIIDIHLYLVLLTIPSENNGEVPTNPGYESNPKNNTEMGYSHTTRRWAWGFLESKKTVWISPGALKSYKFSQYGRFGLYAGTTLCLGCIAADKLMESSIDSRINSQYERISVKNDASLDTIRSDSDHPDHARLLELDRRDQKFEETRNQPIHKRLAENGKEIFLGTKH
jgi:hypothetical protein